MPRKVTSQWEFGDLFASRPKPKPAPDTPPPTGSPAPPGPPGPPASPAGAPATSPGARPRTRAKSTAAEPSATGSLAGAAFRRVFSVGEITGRIKDLLEDQLGTVWVSGEITNFRAQSSGHLYFAVKDATAQLSCVLFRGTPVADRASLKDGQKVVLQGDLTVYAPRGQYQLVVRAAELQGLGALRAAFERLKQQLAAEGLFDPARKRPLPRFPQRVGLVTSASGAALRDILHVVRRRYAGLELFLAPCRVQGQGADLEIAAAIRLLNRWSASAPDRRLDLLIVTRGGGSLEDLWSFNEEAVARAIFESEVPVVSAVGHEIDFTISDFVADLRAATPSAAAELVTADHVACRDALAGAHARLTRLARGMIELGQERLDGLAGRLRRAHPRRQLEQRAQRLDDLQTALRRRMQDGLRRIRQRLDAAAARLAAARPSRRLERAREDLERLDRALRNAARQELERRRKALDRAHLRLELLSPAHTLARGYSITLEAATGRVVRAAEQAPPGTPLLTRLHSGALRSVVVPPAPASGEGGEPSR